ncbi:DUF2924 domain-containing protein [Rhodobacter sp. HX-7-19]|uniref:DUF2924 domain-containing protein n=1 Tax=Paragemmobacter kunshanensis TaxID=2583234 RepID=A0A6M1U5U0_9RHOB|nr:DUF2924 domain-containing protein [Rhodobacter kunshanensis]NGQ93154.1 DUF2924 domain-containing protein [Rhodobacter kunshanensis]
MSPLPTIAALEAMERAELLAAWTAIFGGPAPRSISQPLLRRFLAIEIQARRSGGLTAKFHAGLDRAARQETRAAARPLQPGGRLLREWNGVTHVVEVTGDGYHWNGAVYRSLSAIAREITGAHWSGPRFFGLKGATAS